MPKQKQKLSRLAFKIDEAKCHWLPLFHWQTGWDSI